MFSHRRLVLALLSLLLVAGGLLAPAGPASARAKQAMILSLSAPASVASGESATVSGVLRRRDLARPLGGRRVQVQTRAVGATRWSTVKTLTTRSNGSYSTPVRILRNTQVRAYFAGDRRYRAVASPARTVTATQSLVVEEVGLTTVDAGEPVVMAGRASTGLRGATVRLEQRRPSGWVSVKTATIDSAGGWRLSGTTTLGGADQEFRARVAPTTTIQGAASESRFFTVYAWYPLTDLQPLTAPQEDERSINFEPQDSVTALGRTYRGLSWVAKYSSDGFSGFESGRSGFLLATQCDTLQSDQVLLDAGPDAAWNFLVFTDGSLQRTTRVEDGQRVALELPVTGVTRLRLVNDRVLGSPDGAAHAASAAWAGGRIKCAGDPSA